MNDTVLIESQSMREEYVARVEVLDKVKQLALLPDDLHATIDMTASYYEVNQKTVEALIQDHKKELESDGLRVLKGNELSYLKQVGAIPKNTSAQTVIPRRAILRIGMLLRDSHVAQEVRTYLLNVEEVAQEKAPNIIDESLERMRLANESTRFVIDLAKQAGVDSRSQLVLTKFIYGQVGIDLPIEVEVQQRFLTCEEIAKRVGIYSGSDKPHKQVVSMIMNQLPVPESDKMIVLETNGKWQGSTVKYAESVLSLLNEYLKEQNYPESFEFNKRSYRVKYATLVRS